jgi:hypothetical protein
MSRTNYLNNRDMMKEIHLSKNSYCSFQDPVNDHQFDVILHKVTDIHQNILAAQTNRAERIRRETGEEADPLCIPVSDLVFRIMTWDHIPLAPPKPPKAQKKSKAQKFLEEIEPEVEEPEEDIEKLIMTAPDPTHIRVNFPPFQHYRINTDHSVRCVGKSHWAGDLDTGSFSKTHGQMTENLALMFLKLCERYATRSNWRGYTYNEEMRGAALVQLSQIGLQFDESKSSNPFSYFTATLTNSFTRILNIEKRNQDLRDDLLEQHGLTPSFSRQMKWSNSQEF